ncbi:protein of unknown function [Tessaracoccus bendigoensis DSM 12906]|uniref:DUF948 domain-containing protein n=1 Tax=Tessaracoccus bendigoensis DSM 12906 TaxID=1123357 RepID=A0A1M6MLK3_9ACTN|nr:DUF948 domain-containing protein [Tessaracoccus bendigoensis]SHJ84375.1 protein of unknown function [Tessaracoccus bendigoensis DSM 12906]
MTVGEIAGLIAAVALCVLVALAAVPLLKLGRTLDEVRLAVRDVGNNSVPILHELKSTVVAANDELAKLSIVTDDAAKVSGHATVVSENAAQLTSLFSATLGGPLVKTAAFTYGVRKAVQGRKKAAR